MTSHIKEYLDAKVPVDVTTSMAAQLVRMVIQFEVRDEHPLTLNSQMFGVNKFIFTSRDRQLFFDLIGYSEGDIVKVIDKIPSINNEFKVISDAFNIMSVYVAHLILTSKLTANLKHDTVISILNYMQYRFIGSAVNHYFPHGSSYEIMQTVIESLSMKFSVRQEGSWKKVVNSRSESLAFDTRAHHATLLKFDSDKDILYLISDTSTRIRSQLKIITAAYYDMKNTDNVISSHSSTTTIEGEKVLRERDGSYEMMSSSVFHKVLNKSTFVDERYIRMVQNSVPRLNVGIIRRMLAAISDEAKNQVATGDTNKIAQKNNDVELYIGIDALVSHMIHVIYTSAIHNNKVNINSKISIYTNTRNVFAAARTANAELVSVRASLDDLIKRTRISTRESTISGLTVAFALFITLMTFSSL